MRVCRGRECGKDHKDEVLISLVEMKFLCNEFMITRYILTVPGVLFIGMVTEWFVDAKVIIAESEKTETSILEDIYSKN